MHNAVKLFTTVSEPVADLLLFYAELEGAKEKEVRRKRRIKQRGGG